MTASATDIATVRRWVAEPTTTTYNDSILSGIIEKFPITDAAGYDPLLDDGIK